MCAPERADGDIWAKQGIQCDQAAENRLGTPEMFECLRSEGDKSMNVQEGKRSKARGKKLEVLGGVAGMCQGVSRVETPGASKHTHTQSVPGGPETMRPEGQAGSPAWVLQSLETPMGWDLEERKRKVETGPSTWQQSTWQQ